MCGPIERNVVGPVLVTSPVDRLLQCMDKCLTVQCRVSMRQSLSHS